MKKDISAPEKRIGTPPVTMNKRHHLVASGIPRISEKTEGSNQGDVRDPMFFFPQLNVNKQLSAPNTPILHSTLSLPEGILPEDDTSSLKSREKQLAKGWVNLEVQNKQLEKLRKSVGQMFSEKGKDDLHRRKESAKRRELMTERENKLIVDEENLKKRQISAELELELQRESQNLELAKEADRLEAQKQKLDLEVQSQQLEHQRTVFNQEKMLFAKEKDLEQKNKAVSDRENQLAWDEEKLEKRKESVKQEQKIYKEEKDAELKIAISTIQEAKLAEKMEAQKKCDQSVWKLAEAEHQLKMDTADMQKNRRGLKEERLQQNEKSAMLSIRERLLATGEEKLKRDNLQLEKEQVVLRNDKDLSTKRNAMARKVDLSLEKREQMMVRREEVFFQRELEMKKEKESFKKEKNRNEAFSRTLAKEKEEQVNYKVKLKKREHQLREDLKMREDKLKVDMRTFDKQKRQHKLLIRDLTMIHQPPFSGSSGQSRCSGRVSSASMISTMSEVFVNKSHSTDFSKQMNPTAEVIHKRITLHHVLRTLSSSCYWVGASEYS